MGKLKNIKDKVIVSIDTELKNSYKLTENVTIQLERNVENLNKRETQAVNAVIVVLFFVSYSYFCVSVVYSLPAKTVA